MYSVVVFVVFITEKRNRKRERERQTMAVDVETLDLSGVRVDDVEALLRQVLHVSSSSSESDSDNDNDNASVSSSSVAKNVSVIVGGGKKTRARYAEVLPKHVMSLCQTQFKLTEDRSGKLHQKTIVSLSFKFIGFCLFFCFFSNAFQ